MAIEIKYDVDAKTVTLDEKKYTFNELLNKLVKSKVEIFVCKGINWLLDNKNDPLESCNDDNGVNTYPNQDTGSQIKLWEQDYKKDDLKQIVQSDLFKGDNHSLGLVS